MFVPHIDQPEIDAINRAHAYDRLMRENASDPEARARIQKAFAEAEKTPSALVIFRDLKSLIGKALGK